MKKNNAQIRSKTLNFNSHSLRLSNFRRSGIITFWAIISIPAFLILLCIVLEVGNLWLGRIQLKNALESGALAAVKNWGDAGGGDTDISRQVGNQFAASMLLNGTSVDLSTLDGTLNYNAMNGTNQNGTCDSVFIFGSITDDDPEYTFDSCSAAGCSPPFVIAMDVTSQGNLNTGNNNEWGISVQPTQPGMSNITVRRVIYQIPAGQNGQFDFTSDPPEISSNLLDGLANNKHTCSAGNIICSGGTPTGVSSQADVFGVTPAQVDFYIDVPFGDDGFGGRLECVPGSGNQVTMGGAGQTSKTLAVEFCDANAVGCEPFNLGDRIRFGAIITPTMGGGQRDGDDVGDFGVEVTVCLSDGTFLQGTFTDTTHSAGACPCATATFPFWGNCPTPLQGLTLHPAGIPDVPCPGPAPGNNGQSLLSFNVGGGSSGLGYAVRAQATYSVPSICNNLFSLPIGPFTVSATADAIYDCPTRRPRLYHIDNNTIDFTCNAPCP